MKAIGPYVVVREVSPAAGAPARAGGLDGISRTLLATDRVTGMPALLHELRRPVPAPNLPRSGSLLPFLDLVLDGGQPYLVTELPPHASPANDPVLAARGALSALTALHGQELAHGHIDAGQLWSVDGRVLLAGGGLQPLGGDYTVARDLQDLARTLDQIGGLPDILALLRQPPEHLSAYDAHKLLETGTLDAAAPSLPPLNPLSLLDSSAPLPQQGSYVRQTTLEAPPSRQGGAPLTMSDGAGGPDVRDLNLNIDEWTFPDLNGETGPETPSARPTKVVMPSKPITLQWAIPRPGEPPTSPVSGTGPAASAPAFQVPESQVPEGQVPEGQVPENQVAGSQVSATASAATSLQSAGPQAADPQPAEQRRAAHRALQRLRADTSRLRTLAEARRDLAPGEWESVAGQPAAAPDAETPQERRQREQQAMRAQAELDARNAEQRRSAPAVTSSPESEARPAEQRRELKPFRATWQADQTWQVLRQGGARGAPGASSAPRWLWPVLGLLIAAVMLAALAQGLHRRSATAATACCDVQFVLRGASAQGKTAQLFVETAPESARLQAGQRLGTAPGTVHLSAPGPYRLRVSTDGFMPASLNVSVPASGPITINLGP